MPPSDRLSVPAAAKLIGCGRTKLSDVCKATLDGNPPFGWNLDVIEVTARGGNRGKCFRIDRDSLPIGDISPAAAPHMHSDEMGDFERHDAPESSPVTSQEISPADMRALRKQSKDRAKIEELYTVLRPILDEPAFSKARARRISEVAKIHGVSRSSVYSKVALLDKRVWVDSSPRRAPAGCLFVSRRSSIQAGGAPGMTRLNSPRSALTSAKILRTFGCRPVRMQARRRSSFLPRRCWIVFVPNAAFLFLKAQSRYRALS